MLETINLQKSFGGIVAANNINLKIPASDEKFIGIIGPNGAGKTTLINLLTGFLRPDGGQVIFINKDITKTSPEVRTRMGIIRTFQIPMLFENLTVKEILSLSVVKKRINNDFKLFKNLVSNKYISAKVEYLLGLFDLAKYSNVKAKELPFGIKRLLEIAAAFALEPVVLFLDEPFAGLNDQEIEDLINILTKFSQQISNIVIVEHKITHLQKIIDRLIVMASGTIVADGKPDIVINSDIVRKVYWGQ